MTLQLFSHFPCTIRFSSPISDAARNVLDEEGKLVGYEKLADDKREQNTDRLEILPPIFEKENIYNSFKTNADYYLYGKKSKEEVVDAIVESFSNIGEIGRAHV